mmetsp:Transcript_40365/g.79318  ORF Transcript_40365/g.79318 Transcript_40365/m.79318 type:complete len:269 (-) Transcript_40365:40-846(-)
MRLYLQLSVYLVKLARHSCGRSLRLYDQHRLLENIKSLVVEVVVGEDQPDLLETHLADRVEHVPFALSHVSDLIQQGQIVVTAFAEIAKGLSCTGMFKRFKQTRNIFFPDTSSPDIVYDRLLFFRSFCFGLVFFTAASSFFLLLFLLFRFLGGSSARACLCRGHKQALQRFLRICFGHTQVQISTVWDLAHASGIFQSRLFVGCEEVEHFGREAGQLWSFRIEPAVVLEELNFDVAQRSIRVLHYVHKRVLRDLVRQAVKVDVKPDGG